MLLILLCLLSLASQEGAAADPDPRVAVREAYHEAWTGRDAAALTAVWRAKPALVLSTFDADLEAGLAAWEAGAEGHEALTAEHFERAVWAAELAAAALDRPIFGDYAHAFTGWDAEERKRFRRGQAAFGEANAALREEKAQEARARAAECREIAIALGDWWGTAMGLGIEGTALLALERPKEAAVAFARARLLNHQLGLFASEFRALRGLVDALIAADDNVRAIRAANDGLVYARDQGDVSAQRALLDARRTAESALDDEAAATSTAAEIAALGQ
ncbi:MAG: hypothetical protein WD226_06365 [Planctomycetota bacterium]